MARLIGAPDAELSVPIPQLWGVPWVVEEDRATGLQRGRVGIAVVVIIVPEAFCLHVHGRCPIFDYVPSGDRAEGAGIIKSWLRMQEHRQNLSVIVDREIVRHICDGVRISVTPQLLLKVVPLDILAERGRRRLPVPVSVVVLVVQRLVSYECLAIREVASLHPLRTALGSVGTRGEVLARRPRVVRVQLQRASHGGVRNVQASAEVPAVVSDAQLPVPHEELEVDGAPEMRVRVVELGRSVRQALDGQVGVKHANGVEETILVLIARAQIPPRLRLVIGNAPRRGRLAEEKPRVLHRGGVLVRSPELVDVVEVDTHRDGRAAHGAVRHARSELAAFRGRQPGRVFLGRLADSVTARRLGKHRFDELLEE